MKLLCEKFQIFTRAHSQKCYISLSEWKFHSESWLLGCQLYCAVNTSHWEWMNGGSSRDLSTRVKAHLIRIWSCWCDHCCVFFLKLFICRALNVEWMCHVEATFLINFFFLFNFFFARRFQPHICFWCVVVAVHPIKCDFSKTCTLTWFSCVCRAIFTRCVESQNIRVEMVGKMSLLLLMSTFDSGNGKP